MPGLIHARDFGYLKQEDDWYILAADPSRSVSLHAWMPRKERIETQEG